MSQQTCCVEPTGHMSPGCGWVIGGAITMRSLRSATWRGVAMVETASATVERRTAKNCMVQGSIEVGEDERRMICELGKDARVYKGRK